MTPSGLGEMIRESSNSTYELPDEVDATRTEEIDQLLQNNRWRYEQDWWVVVLSVVHWTLASECDTYADKRKHGQDKACEAFDTELSDIQTWCGKQLFDEAEFMIEDKHVQRKWQALFEQLLRILDDDHPMSD